jgi:chromosome segregation ATPase
MTTDSPSQEISYDDVAAAASRLQDAGTPVTLDALAEALDASPSAIGRHLRAWRAEHEQPAAPAPAELPAALAAELAKWARQYADESGAGARAAQAQLEHDMDALLEAGARLEAEHDDLSTQFSAARSAAADQLEEIERLSAELRNARQVAMDALVSKAKDQLAIDGKDAQLADLRGQLERSVAASATQSDARLAAEMELVGATTARDSLAAELKDVQAQLAAAKSDRGALRMEIDALRKKAK